MQILEKVWSSVLLNFIIKLLPSKEPIIRIEFDSILIIINKLTKWGTFISYKESLTVEDLTYTFFWWIVAKHRLPQELILDKDKLFTLRFWIALMA